MVSSTERSRTKRKHALLWGLALGCTIADWMPASAATLPEIRERRHLIVAVKDNLYPLGYRDKAGVLQGFEVAIARRLAQTLFNSDQALILKPVPNVDRLTAVSAGTVDMAIAQITLTENRMRLVRFSSPYYRSGTGILTREARWNRLQTLSRQKIAVLQPSVTLPSLRSALPKATLTGVPTYVAAQALLDQGQVQAIVGDQVILSGLAQQQPQYQFYATPLTVQPLAIALPKGVQYDSLYRWVEQTLQEWQRDGWLAQQQQIWGLP
jgi:polar amino acid transport system substrate-binding protein